MSELKSDQYSDENLVYPAFKSWELKLLLGYIFFLPFVRLYSLPGVGAKIQPAEVIFFGLIPLVIRWVPFFWASFPRPGKLVLIVYLGTNLVSGFLAGELNGILEAIGRVYLMFIFLLGWMFAIRGGNLFVRKAVQIWSFGAFIMACFSLVGYVSGILGYLNETVALYERYPYLGTVLRVSGFTGGPGMLIIVLVPGILFTWAHWTDGWYKWMFILLMGVAFLTFSKEIILVFISLWLISDMKPWALSKWSVMCLICLIYIFGSHYMIAHIGGMNDGLGTTQFTSGQVLFQVGEYQVIETSYTTLKRTAVFVGASHPLFGVGPGNFQTEVSSLQMEGLYPAHLPAYEPHSTWIGGFAELGWVGLLGLCAVVIWLFIYGYSQHTILWKYHESRIILVYVLMILVISISMDVLNFRHLWLPLGLLIGLSSRANIWQSTHSSNQ